MANSESEGKDGITLDDLQNLFSELRMIAASLLKLESGRPTYTPTALAVSALRRAKPQDQNWEDLRWENRAHFFSALSRAMRNAPMSSSQKPKKPAPRVIAAYNDIFLIRFTPATAAVSFCHRSQWVDRGLLWSQAMPHEAFQNNLLILNSSIRI